MKNRIGTTIVSQNKNTVTKFDDKFSPLYNRQVSDVQKKADAQVSVGRSKNQNRKMFKKKVITVEYMQGRN